MMVALVRCSRLIRRTVLVAALSPVCLESGIAQTQDSTAHEASAAANDSAAEASKEAANPLANVWLMQFQQNNNWIEMPPNGNRVQNNLQFQPLMSMRLTDDWNLIVRPVLEIFKSTPYQDQTGQANRVTAFGDTVLALAVSPGPNVVGNWLLAAGPTFIFPTATDSLIGQNKWQVGPAVAVGYKGKNFITYVFPQQWFSIGGDGRRTNHMLLYYAYVYVLPDGWSVGTNPGMFVDWEASGGNKVAFPVGLQVGKLLKLGPLPVKFDVQAQYFAVSPNVNGPKWNLQFQVTPILPQLIKRKLLW